MLSVRVRYLLFANDTPILSKLFISDSDTNEWLHMQSFSPETAINVSVPHKRFQHFFANPMGFINRFFIIADEGDNDCYRLYIIMLISDR